ncbi:hypothetical protein DXG03_001726 [Asterophora parasitica]|uniref:Uncharacterized protein n=1 Tax=Asterophora parasitica TaxID=117018 RepID=A0A9P7GH44_9AGAR|nr:hypothetical protein DXG03_001726 [Asterophora parasitica]
MALAQHLTELALANSEGLLNDDEYRLLRQNLFEQHANSVLIPVEVPILPVAGPGRKSSISSTNPTPTRTLNTHVDTPLLAPPTLRRKGSFVTNLFRRATGQKGPASGPTRSPSAPAAKAPKRKQSIPQIIQRKASELFSGRRADPPAPVQDSSPDSPQTRHSFNPPLSPRRTIPTLPSISTLSVDTPSSISVTNEVFDDRNLNTVKEIRAAIIATETEAQRLLEAFTNLESTTVHRVEFQNARRLSITTPDHPSAQMDGTDWPSHHHPQMPSPPSPIPSRSDRKGKGRANGHRHMPSLVDSIADSSSVYSASSSISRSKSISSLRSKQPPHPPSPLSPRFPSLASPPPQPTRRPRSSRKNSVSSVVSHGTRLGISPSPSLSLSRSTGHLPLRTLIEGEGASRFFFTDRDGDWNLRSRPGTAETLAHPEVQEAQRRRAEVMARYSARLDYLQAKLKSAELHEKLARR